MHLRGKLGSSVGALIVLLVLPLPLAHAGPYSRVVQVGDRLCLETHYHRWRGQGRTESIAALNAVGGWSDFTAAEYGFRWARFALAENQSVECSHFRGRWTCTARARPCRQFRGQGVLGRRLRDRLNAPLPHRW